MTTVFVYEYCCALGLGREPSDPAHSLYREGWAMLEAVYDDFRSAPPDIAVCSILATTAESERSDFRRAASRADWSLVVAPEFTGLLETRCDWVMDVGGKLLGPSVETVRLTADKLRLAEHWTRHAVPSPPTWSHDRWPAERFPAVLKPRHGAGSVTTFRLDASADLARGQVGAEAEGTGSELIAQDYVPGRPVSVAFLVGPAQAVPLLPTFQLLSSDGRFRYEGGELPIPPDLAERAITLGRRATDCVPGLLGYVGVDLVLGDAADGSQDYAIEINPRLTTSYVGLRELADFNLAEAMLRVVNGESVKPRWKPGRVRFRPDGSVSVDPTSGPASG